LSLLHVLIDTRERKPLVFSPDIRTSPKKLHIGDYSLIGMTKHITVERKGFRDWNNCCRDFEKFRNQLDKLATVEYSTIIVEGSIPSRAFRRWGVEFSPILYLETTARIAVEYNIPVIFSGGRRNCAKCTEIFLKRSLIELGNDH